MKRAMFLTILAASLTFGASGAHAYPTNPIRVSPNSAIAAYPNGPCVLSRGQLIRLLLPLVVPSVP
jgi:hypothetical protein